MVLTLPGDHPNRLHPHQPAANPLVVVQLNADGRGCNPGQFLKRDAAALLAFDQQLPAAIIVGDNDAEWVRMDAQDIGHGAGCYQAFLAAV